MNNCPVCGIRLQIAVSSIVTRYYAMDKFDPKTMTVVMGESTTRETHLPPSYYVFCPRCQNRYPVTIEQAPTKNGDVK